MDRNQVEVLGFTVRFVRNQAVDEELVQEVFLQVIRSAARYEASAKFTTWLYTLARHRSIDYLRQAKNRNAVADSTEIAVENVTAERNAERKQLQFALENAIAELQEDQ